MSESHAWMPFDCAAPPPDGFYWVAGERPVFDCDVDDYGPPIGWRTGELKPFVALVHLSTSRDEDEPGALVWDAVDAWNLGEVREDDVVAYVAPFVTPAHPGAAIVSEAPVATPAEPADEHWGSDPVYPVEDWRYLVSNDETRLGYADWVESMREQAFDEQEEFL